ncbi:MAG: DUF6102 family protein [Clostridia bacterium]|nr:DUF6102 family protein [Clostridia bacterium]
MEVLLVALIVAILTGCLAYVNNILSGLVPITLHAERYMTTLLGTDAFSQIFNIFFGFGISLIVLKFLKKGFETYILWTEGDADADPLFLLTNFFKAIAIAVSFPVLYGWLANIVDELTNKLLTTVGNSMQENFSAFVSGISSAGLFTGIVSLIFFIVFFLLYVQFLMRGLEILILRIGVPVACVGLLDSDKGVFRSYMQKFFQSTLAVIVQVTLAKISVGLMLNGHAFWGLAAVTLSVRAPKFLQEFMIMSGGSPSGVMGTVYQSVRLVQMAKGAFK